MSDVFEGYERQYCELSTSLSRKCHSVSALSDGEEKKGKIDEIKSGIEEADVLIRKMDLEARSLHSSAKAVCLSKLREYKSDLNQLKKEFKRVSSADTKQSSREELMESGMADLHAVSADQRGRLAMSVERLDQSSDRIRESRRLMLETEEVGISIVQDLSQQRQTLLHAHTKKNIKTHVDKIGGSGSNGTMRYQSNDGTSSVTTVDDSKENLNQVINSIDKILTLLHQLHLTVTSFTPASQLHLLQRLNSLVMELDNMDKLSEKCNIQIPMEVLTLIDDGKNPDDFTKDVLNSCIARNQVTKGKTDAFRKHILEELEQTFPDEVDMYREIRANSVAEAKRVAQSQSVLPNGDAKVKNEL